MEHKPQSLRVKAVERLLGKLRQEGKLVVKPVVTHPPKLPYKRHNPNETGLKRYELKGGRYLIRSNEPRRNRKCKNLDCERLRQSRTDDQREACHDASESESIDSKPDAKSLEIAVRDKNAVVSATSTTSSVMFFTATANTASLTTSSCAKTPTTEVAAKTSSPEVGSNQNHHHHHHNLSQSQHGEDEGQAFFLQTDHSMFYLSSLEDGFLTEEITEQI